MTRPDRTLPDAELASLLREVARHGAGAEVALAQLYRCYRMPVLGHLCRSGLDKSDAQDVLHEVFLKLAESAGQLRAEASAGAWFWAIVRNQKIDHLRAQGKEISWDDEAWAAFADQQPADANEPHAASELERCVGLALQRFGRVHPRRADAIRLMYEQQWTLAQLAEYLDRTKHATEEYLSKSRKALKAFIATCAVWLTA